MTKAEFAVWLQEQFDRVTYPGNDQQGDAWRDIESAGLLEEIGVTCAWDYIGNDMIFRCSDGLLASGYEIGIEQETIWFFSEGQVENNMRDYTERELGSAIGVMDEALDDLRKL